MTNRRVPAGTPAGGQFATAGQPRAGLTLTGPAASMVAPADLQSRDAIVVSGRTFEVTGKPSIEAGGRVAVPVRSARHGAETLYFAATRSVLTQRPAEQGPSSDLLLDDAIEHLVAAGIDRQAAQAQVDRSASGPALIPMERVEGIWRSAHAEDFVTYSAEPAGPAGVAPEVLAQVNGGREVLYVTAQKHTDGRPESAVFLVDAEEYRARTGIFPFVVDPDRHAQLVSGSGGKKLATNPQPGDAA